MGCEQTPRRPFVKPTLTRHGALERLTLQTGGLVAGGTFFGASGASGQWTYDDESREWVWMDQNSAH